MSDLDKFIESTKGKKLSLPVDFVIRLNMDKLNHKLPDKKWEAYMIGLIEEIQSDTPPLKKTVRCQKYIRYIYDNEVMVLESQLKQKNEAIKLFREGLECVDGAFRYYDDTYKNHRWDVCCSGHECGCQGQPIDPEYYIYQSLISANDKIKQVDKILKDK